MSSEQAEPGTGTSLSLIERVRANDATAWQRFVLVYSPLVYAWVKRCGLNSHDAADVMQDVFHAVARGLSRFRPEPGGTFRGWLWTVTRNKARDHIRARAAEPVGGTDMQRRLGEVPESEPESWSESGECGRAALIGRAAELVRADFQPHTWQAFWRSAVENQPAREIAEALGMTVDAVYQAKARVLARLREELGELE